MKWRFRIAALLAVVAICGTDSPGVAQFTAGDITVYQVGNGSGTLTNNGNVVILKEFNQSGIASSFSLTLPSTGGGTKLIAAGLQRSEGLLTLGNNGQTLAMTGYNSAGEASSLVGTASTTINRSVALVNGQGTATLTSLTDFANGSNPRGAYTTNGTDIWVTGGAGGVRYTTSGSTTSTQLSTDVIDLRGVAIAGGQLYVSTNQNSIVLGKVGTGTPTTSGQSITNLPSFPTSGSPYQFFFARVGTSPSSSYGGPNVVYVADDGGTIQKYITTDGTSWTASGSVTATAVRGLTGLVTGNDQITIFATTGGTTASGGGSVYKFTDSAASTGDITGGGISPIATAGTNTAYRGVAFSAARLEWQDSATGNWDLSATKWTNTAPTSAVANQKFFNAYAANFGAIAQDNAVTVGAGVNPQAVNVTNAANTYTFTNTSGTLGIQGLGALTKSGNGNLILASGNSYSGGTIINGGTVFANNGLGSATGIGSIIVNSGGTLRGEGSVAGAVTVNPGGTVGGGSLTSSITPLTINNVVNIIGAASNGGALAVDFNGVSTNGANVGGLSLGSGGVLNFQTTGAGSGPVAIRLLNVGGLQPNTTYTFNLVNGQSEGFTLNGSSVTEYTADTDFTLSSSNFTFSGVTLIVSEDNTLLLTFTTVPIPEPPTTLAIAAATLGLATVVRRRVKRYIAAGLPAVRE